MADLPSATCSDLSCACKATKPEKEEVKKWGGAANEGVGLIINIPEFTPSVHYTPGDRRVYVHARGLLTEHVLFGHTIAWSSSLSPQTEGQYSRGGGTSDLYNSFQVCSGGIFVNVLKAP